jgi:hypothetical protein
VASAPEPRWRPSGHRQGFVTIVGGRACPWRRSDCPPGVGASAPAPQRQFHVATTGASAPARAVCSVTWGSASADRSITALKPLPRTPVPRPTGQGSRPPARGRRRSSEHRPPRTNRDRVIRPLRKAGGSVPPGHGKRRPSGHRAHGLTGAGNCTSSEAQPPTPPGARQTALFGAPRARPHRDREPGALRSIGPPTPPGQGTTPLRRRGPPPHPGHGKRHSSGRRAHGLTGTGNHTSSEARPPIPPETGNHTSSEARPPTSNPARAHCSRRQGTPAHRGTADGVLRGTARTASPESSNRRPSGHRAPGSTGTGQTAPLGAPRAPPRRDREPALLGGPAPHLTGPVPRHGMGTPPTGAGQTALFGAPPATPRRDRDPELLGARATDPTGAGNPSLLGGPAPPPRLGRGPPASPRQPAPLGAPRTRTRDWNPGPPRRPGPPISRATGHPAPRGRATGDSRAGISGLYATRLGGLAVGNGHRPRSETRAGQDGNGRKATAAVMRYGCWRGEIFKGCEPRRGASRPSDRVAFGWHVTADCEKRGEPLTGCGVQQTRDPHAEQTVEVVRNHEGGTRVGAWQRRPEGSLGSREWTREGYAGGRATLESHERRNQREAVPALSRAL